MIQCVQTIIVVRSDNTGCTYSGLVRLLRWPVRLLRWPVNSLRWHHKVILICVPRLTSVWCLTSISSIISISRKISVPWKFPYPGKFLYPVNFPYFGFLHEFIHIFIPGLSYPGKLPYPGKYPYRVIFLYPVKYLIRNSNW